MPSILVKHFRGFTSIRAKHLRAIDRASLRIGNNEHRAVFELSQNVGDLLVEANLAGRAVRNFADAIKLPYTVQ